ncbi:hypothetical protein LIP_0335 [Limnochorda pilosa]|uniref:DNA-3-methyladenine glycosylase II n=1 Tax=Limnochorda pilosa TaxID=1555112 RepID=A0A0K2SGP2_LIMPI|nr:hypothetical protein LIP_0335 [Limnochorda pilosa]
MDIDLPEPFSAERTLAFLQRSSLGVPYSFGPHGARRAVHLDGHLYGLDFRFQGRCLRVSLLAAQTDGAPHRDPQHDPHRAPAPGAARPGTARRGLTPPDAERLRSLARHLWGLDDDLEDGYRVLGEDPRMASLLAAHRGLSMTRTPDPYEALLTVVIGQQVSVRAASAVRRRLLAELGDAIEWEGEPVAAYPTPERILEARPERLQTVGLSRQKARYVLEIAVRAAAGELEPQRFAGLDDQEALERLMEIPGVGRWTAENVLIRGLGRRDVLPAADLGILVAVQRLMGWEHRPTEAEVRALGVRWQGYRSHAALYLWALLGGT